MLGLYKDMLILHAEFILDRIPNHRHAIIFKQEVSSIIDQCNQVLQASSPEEYKFNTMYQLFMLHKVAIELKKEKLFSKFLKNKEVQLLALDIAEDLFISLNTRFINGSCKAYEGLFKINKDFYVKSKQKRYF